jgi:D-alanyl-D-alanine carboxypeptidase
MRIPRLRNTIVLICYCAALNIAVFSASPALAERASLVIDANTGAVLHANNARLKSFPASLTKLMTVYIAFEAMASKQIAPADKLHVSANAARMPATKLGLMQGQTISLQNVLFAMILRSANDAAVVIAERLAGTESAFANLMNAKAKALGMTDTRFYNASGLPHSGQITSARDMAILTRALMTEYPQYYSLFQVRTFQYRGKTFNARNNYTNNTPGTQGLKTGFTCHAGYNLVASSEKNGRRLIGVILGERNPGRRNARMSKIVNQAHNAKSTEAQVLTISDLAIEAGQDTSQAINAKAIAEVCTIGSPKPDYAKAAGWGLVIGVKKDHGEAMALSRRVVQTYPKSLNAGRPLAIPFLRGVLLNRAIITDLKQENATSACRQLRRRNQYCIVINPKVVYMYVQKAHLASESALTSSDHSRAGKSSSMQ